MCGIAGLVHADGRPVDPAVLMAMTRALAPRGPDDEGIEILPSAGPGAAAAVGFGHRRLSIIDLSPAGHQPMCNEDGRVWLTFNGEIYNYRELKRNLQVRGHVFRSNTDTETIIHGYEEYGPDFFQCLNGMFALGLWDCRNETLYLARDPYGQKPLYYRESRGDLSFASEIKALLRDPDFSPEIDPEGLSRYLSYEYVPAPHSILKGVKKLSPGHFLTWQNGRSRIRSHWRIDFDGRPAPVKLDLAEVEHRLLDRLAASVERILVSDVPIGVFLSGGIDSSAVVALMSKIMPPDRIKTFSIGFDDASFDESEYARYVARHFGTDHREQRLTARKMIEILPEIWNFLDEPLADASIIPTHLLARFTREHVTVALGGDGGDELFAGYDTFVAHRAANLCRLAPRFLFDGVVGPAVNRLPVSTANMSFDFKAKQFLKGLPFEPARRNQVWLGSFTPGEQVGLLQPDLARSLNGFDPYRDMDLAAEGVDFRDQVDRLVFLYSKFYLAEDILTKVDRASMAVSLEVRAPFLDVEFAEFVNRLPSSLKIRGLSRKFILKKALSRLLPPAVLNRKKKGFGIPLAKWFKEDLKEDLIETLHPDRLEADGLFAPESVQNMIRQHIDGTRDWRKQLFTLYVFQKWKQHTLEPVSVRACLPTLPSNWRDGGPPHRETVRPAASE